MHRYKGRNVDFCVIVELDMKGEKYEDRQHTNIEKPYKKTTNNDL
jgi:hypothetical protein